MQPHEGADRKSNTGLPCRLIHLVDEKKPPGSEMEPVIWRRDQRRTGVTGNNFPLLSVIKCQRGKGLFAEFTGMETELRSQGFSVSYFAMNE